MPSRVNDRRPLPGIITGTALYVAFLVVAPFEHHDILCHLKTPQHCTSCASSVVGSDPATHAPLAAVDLADAGGTIAVSDARAGFLLAVRTTGRSPPAFS